VSHPTTQCRITYTLYGKTNELVTTFSYEEDRKFAYMIEKAKNHIGHKLGWSMLSDISSMTIEVLPSSESPIANQPPKVPYYD